MVYTFDGFNYLIRLNRGENLLEMLSQFAAKTRLDGAWISGIGGASQITLGFYHLNKKEYAWKTFDGAFEINSLQGNLSLNELGEPMFHLHGTFSRANYETLGGHVKDLVAAATVEVFVHRAYKPLRRKTDPEVGLQTLDLKDA